MTNWCNDFANFVPGETFRGIFDEGYNIIYGFGYVKVLQENDELEKNMQIFVPLNDDLKVQKISLVNKTEKIQNCHIEYSLDMVLGVAKEMTSSYVLCRKNNDRLEFKNSYNQYFSNIVTYLKINSLEADANVEYNEFDYTVKIDVKVPANGKADIAILLGSTMEYEVIDTVVNKYSTLNAIENEYNETIKYWQNKVVKHFNTGNEYINIMANGWLLYQTIVSRLFSRTGFYQAGGAFGFRDQLQDSMALIRTWPELTRNQILKHASKQFQRGDVLHWWHEHNRSWYKNVF